MGYYVLMDSETDSGYMYFSNKQYALDYIRMEIENHKRILAKTKMTFAKSYTLVEGTEIDYEVDNEDN